MNTWYSADRSEIEGVRSMRNAIQAYLGKKDETKPLSIAVFGPPGSGKSYVVREIGKTLRIKDHLTFNLSQFNEPSELVKAFHEARDRLLKGGRPPLVFWDEFDSPYKGELGWLRFFLSPMQDGEFFDNGAVHPVGARHLHLRRGDEALFQGFREQQAGTWQPRPRREEARFHQPPPHYIDVKGPNPHPQRPR